MFLDDFKVIVRRRRSKLRERFYSRTWLVVWMTYSKKFNLFSEVCLGYSFKTTHFVRAPFPKTARQRTKKKPTLYEYRERDQIAPTNNEGHVLTNP